MSETQQVLNSIGSIPSSDKTEDTLTKMKVNEEKTDEPSLYPDRPGEQDCHYFLRTGKCGYGSSCRYNHPVSHVPEAVFYHREELPERIGQPDCEYYLKTGACKYGATCKYHHPKDRNGAGPVLFNALGYPMRQGEKSCPYYMQKGMCRFGVACKFNHPQTQTHNVPPTSFPSVGLPYASGLPVMSLPSATYGVMDRPQAPHHQAYLPFMVAPPQGWSTYMGGSNPIYDVKIELDSNTERAECWFFMKNGTCKYGDNCKYSHPKERMVLSQPPNLFNSVVLPARPGQPACGNFKAYGFCKYGASCKFDHPVPVNPYQYAGLTVPSPPTAYTPPVSTQVKITSPPGRSDSTTVSNGNKPAAENQSTETDKQDDGLDKSEVQDSSQLSHSDSAALSNEAENPSSEAKKEDDDPSPADDTSGELQGSSDNAA
ncbi:Zinc finger CCCH domain-containing protein 26 [Hirschfeldia incana]|nr:Zinc finger CCCH domain-containing protein 26 [Hirschfeldia incana]